MKLSIANGGVVQYPTKALYDILTNHVINVISASDPAVTHNQGDQCHVISGWFRKHNWGAYRRGGTIRLWRCRAHYRAAQAIC
jgi:hypothetical protein